MTCSRAQEQVTVGDFLEERDYMYPTGDLLISHHRHTPPGCLLELSQLTLPTVDRRLGGNAVMGHKAMCRRPSGDREAHETVYSGGQSIPERIR